VAGLLLLFITLYLYAANYNKEQRQPERQVMELKDIDGILDSVQLGDSKETIEAVLGSPGDCTSTATTTGTVTISAEECQYKAPSTGTKVTVIYREGGVTKVSATRTVSKAGE
jgi:hypothetical protein